MKLITAIRTLLLLYLVVLPTAVFAQYIPIKDEQVSVNADIKVDLYSTVTLRPEIVEVNQPSSVEVRIISPSGQYVSNHSVRIVGSSLNILQPTSLTNSLGRTFGSVSTGIPGTYTVCAKDTTFGFDIDIQSCKTLYVRPLTSPVMLPEPEYTKGTSNTVLWQSLGSGYTYTVQVSRNANFTDIVAQGVGIVGTSYEFKNLSNEQMYFYRVKANNIYGGESAWSSSVFSVQDSENPKIEVLEIGSIGGNNTVDWENDFVVRMSFNVSDNLVLKNVTFSCIRRNGSSQDCSENSTLEGNNFVVNVRLDSLDRVSGVYLYETYNFCVEARDAADNTTRVCDRYIILPAGEMPGKEEPPKQPNVIDRVDKGIEDLNVILDNTVGNLEQKDLQTATTATSVVTASTAVTMAAGTLWEIPYFLTQLILSALSWLGFRKKGKSMGFVYDAVTKEPISQAIVRVFDETKRMVWSDVTDYTGSFSATLEDGRYLIKVRSAKHSFPSSIVFGREDYPLSNVYHGESFETNSGEEILFNIPMDPLELSKIRLFFESTLGRFKFILNILHILLFVGGLIVSIYTYTNYPSTLNLVILLLFIPSFFLILKNILGNKNRYGIVRDENNNVLAGVVVGLRESEFEKIVAKRVTDKFGRYRFMMGKGEYQVEVLETGYSIVSIKDGDRVSIKKDGSTLIAKDMVLREFSRE